MRALIDNLLQQVDGLTEDNIFSAGAIQEDAIPSRPFAVIVMGAATRGVSSVKLRTITVWVHDDPGDYTLIDSIVDGIYGRLDGAEHVTVEGVEAEIIRCDWQSTSDDLYDPGFRTITKNITFVAAGTGA